MADAAVICANRQCRLPAGGKCLEGFEPLTKCPHFGREPANVGEDEASPDDGPAGAFDGLRLESGLALAAVSASGVLGRLPSHVVGIIGASDSGKTSVIAGLYDLFQMGPVAGTLFAGSSTLHGLEMVCHDARVASERDEPHSERTKRGEVRFYHMDVLRENTLRSLLIADRNGEDYEEVADLAANASGMFELRRADVVTILVDGRRLATLEHRADTVGAIPLIIQGMDENGAFVRKPRVAVVLTKHDVVLGSPKRDRVMRDFEAIFDGIREAFADSFGELRSFVTCASPKDLTVERGAGLPELLDYWLRQKAPVRASRVRHSSGRVLDGLKIEEAGRG